MVDNVNVKKFGCVNINDLHLHGFTHNIYNYLRLHAQYWFKSINNIDYKSKSHQMYGNSYEIEKKFKKSQRN
jgi:hypothetical protein